MASSMTQRDLDVTEQLARIREMSAEADARYQEALKVERERSIIPASLLIQSLIAAGALLTAGATLAGIFLK